MKKKATSLESYANAAYREGITYGKKQSQEYVQAVKIGTIPAGYKKAGERKEQNEIKWLKWENGKEWGKIKCPMLDNRYVMTYYPEGVPCYYTYTDPFIIDGDVCYYRYDQDESRWDEYARILEEEYKEGMAIWLG